MASTKYVKHFTPLESNPEVFNQLIYDMGISPNLHFEDIFSLDEPGLLPHPVLALILVFPTSDTYEEDKVKADDSIRAQSVNDDIIWFEQTINNACGLYAILHSIYNSEARAYVQPGSLLGSLLPDPQSLSKEQLTTLLEDSDALETVYNKAARLGDSSPPENAEDEVGFHFVAFVKAQNGHVYELDGDRKSPIDRGQVLTHDEDVLGHQGLNIIRQHINEESGKGVGFSLMALVKKIS